MKAGLIGVVPGAAFDRHDGAGRPSPSGGYGPGGYILIADSFRDANQTEKLLM
jgi:hypothetical protein